MKSKRTLTAKGQLTLSNYIQILKFVPTALARVCYLHDQLMGAGHQSEAVGVVEGFRDVLSEGVAGTSGRDAPPTTIIRVRPQQVTHRALRRRENKITYYYYYYYFSAANHILSEPYTYYHEHTNTGLFRLNPTYNVLLPQIRTKYGLI